MTEVNRKTLVVEFDEDGMATTMINGKKVSVTTDGHASVFGSASVQVKPAAASEADVAAAAGVAEGFQLNVSKDLNSVAVNGAQIKDTDDEMIIATNGTVTLNSATTGNAAQPANTKTTAAPAKRLTIGTVMKDGALYAGPSWDTGEAMFAAPEDETLSMTFNEAVKRAEEKSLETGQKWRVASGFDLYRLYKNREELGGFNQKRGRKNWYWSSSRFGKFEDCADVLNFKNGRPEVGRKKKDTMRVRLVRN